MQNSLRSLEELGIISSRADGNRVVYKSDRSSIIFEELRRIILKTIGFGHLLSEGLSGLRERVDAAFIYGSVADGADRIDSDIDLLIVGDLTLKEVARALAPVKENVDREISVTFYSRGEFVEKYAEGNHFVRSVMSEEKIFVIGGEDDLKKIIE